MSFDFIFAPPIVISILIAFTLLFIFFELKKTHRFRTLRVLATIFLMIALAGILLRPRYSTERSKSTLLLTPGYSEGQIDSIVSQNPRLSLMHLSEAKPFRKSRLLSDTDLLKERIDFVAGEGMPLYLLDKMHGTSFVYMPTSSPKGIIEINQDENYRIHRKGLIKGLYHSKSGDVAIKLEGPSGVEDSVTVTAKGSTPFRLTFMPRESGNFVYTLIIRDSIHTVRETLPLSIEKEEKLTVLILQSYPTFETQNLKNYLAENNHRVMLRYQLSKNNFRDEFINHERIPIRTLSKELLSNVDILISDDRFLTTLSTGERTTLETSIKSGLGFLFLTPREKKGLSTFFPFESTSINKDTTVITLSDKSYGLPASRIRVGKQPTIVPLLENRSGILNGYTYFSAGKIGFQMLQETYRLRLSGDTLAYAQIWTPLLEKIARRKILHSEIKIQTPFPWYENEPIDVRIISADENVALTDDSIQVPLQENSNLDNVWHGRTWAGRKGWHLLQTQDVSLPYYVHARPAWNALSIASQMRINGLRKDVRPDQVGTAKTSERVPPAVFYIVMLFAAGFIWLSPKL
jgi:hypothetical protein